MRRNLFQKLKNKKGYTLTEMIVVVGIIVILLGISIIGVAELSKNLKMAELDDYAKIIYLEAQEQLSLMEVEGGTDAYYEDIRFAYPKIPEGEDGYNPRFFKEEIYALNQYVLDYPLGATAEEQVLPKKMWEHMCYLTKDDELSKKMIFETSDIYLNGGSYLIEFNPTTGDIYGVFYWESPTAMSYKNDIMTLSSRERAGRKEKQIGYYGGELAGDFVEEEDILQKVSLINGEELYLKISFDEEEGVKARDEGRLSVAVEITGERNNTVTFSTIDLTKNNDSLTSDTLDFYVLLDSMIKGRRFNDIVNASKTGDDQVITPGENLTIKVTSTFTDKNTHEIRKSVKTVIGNSLFANDTNDAQIGISALRHMMNLNFDINSGIYDGDKFPNRNLIQYISNVDFAEKAYAWGWDGTKAEVIYKGYGKAERPLEYINPIENGKVFKESTTPTIENKNRKVTSNGDGVRYALKNFIVNPVQNASGVAQDNVGIFGKIENTDFSNLYVENATVNATGCDNVGALVGHLINGGVIDCGVYLETAGVLDGESILTDYPTKLETDDCHKYLMEHYYDTFRVKGNNNVGGLIGKAEANTAVIIKNSFAATKVDGVSNVGGLIGYVETTSDAGVYVIKQSYASGEVSGKNYVGGFAGEIKSVSSGKIAVTDNYTTGNVYGEQMFAGFIGKTTNADYKKCIAYGEILKKVPAQTTQTTKIALQDSDMAGGFVYDGTDTNVGSSYTDSCYMAQMGYNKSTALKNPADILEKEYSTLVAQEKDLEGRLKDAVSISYPYANILYMQSFPFKKLEEQKVHYGDWAKQFVIDTSLVYYEKYADGKYGYYCVLTASGNDKLWLLDTLRDETCIEDGYGLMTKYKLNKISYDVYVGNTGDPLTKTNVPVNERTNQMEGEYDENQFVYLKQEGSLTFKEIESYDAAEGKVTGDETGATFEGKALYLYLLPYELQCADREGKPYFYDRIVFNATADGGSNKKVIEDVAYLYNPHFAKTAYNPNVSKTPVDITTTTAVPNPKNVYIRSARQLNALGRYPYYWNTRHGFDTGQQVNYLQETDVNFSTYTKVYGGRKVDLQAFPQDFPEGDERRNYCNRPIGNPELSAVGEVKYAGAFKNNYDGQNNKIIDYCVDVSDVQFVGLFGEIQGATLQNIVMVMSPEADRKSANAGLITSDFKTWQIFEDDYNPVNLRRRIMRTSVGALLGMAYDNTYCDDFSNTINNCVASGYTVQYRLSREDTYVNAHNKKNRKLLDPMGIAVGGLIGYGESDITNCAAVNNVEVVLEKDYTNTYDYYTYYKKGSSGGERYEKKTNLSNVAGGIVNVGGFVGSYFYSKVENCYSGGTINIIDNGHTIPNLRIGNFCPGWLDTRAWGLKYDDYKKAEKNPAEHRDSSDCVCRKTSCSHLNPNDCNCSADAEHFRSFEYVNCYTYTMVYDNVFDVETKDMNYVPFASNKVDFYDEESQTWLTEEVIPEKYTTFRDVYYLSDMAVEEKIKDETVFGTSVLWKDLTEVPEDKKANKATADNTYKYAYTKAGAAYPFQEVITEEQVDGNGNKTTEYVHYGDWYIPLQDTSLAYYEKYADGSYGYYCVTTKENGEGTWILDSLKDEVCIEDGYGLLTKYALDSLSAKKGDTTVVCPINETHKMSTEGAYLRFKEYENYDYVNTKAENNQGISVNANDLYCYLYKLPYELQDVGNPDPFYSNENKLTFDGFVNGTPVINQDVCWYNPHFAKTAINASKYFDGKAITSGYRNPMNVYVRSARQLNALGRYDYYWEMTGNSDDKTKVNFIQEVDINFSIYAGAGKTYLGKPFDLQAFGETYSNRPIGRFDDPVNNCGNPNAFKNIYDGRSNLIIDYCVQADDTSGVGLFGVVRHATVKNIVMVVSEEAEGYAGKIISKYRLGNNSFAVEGHDKWNDRIGVGALIGWAYGRVYHNTIENCASSGYTVQYELENGTVESQPQAIAVGGLIGLSQAIISDCTVTNDVKIIVNENYSEDIITINDVMYSNAGRVYLGGFVGSQMYHAVTNCYSGGTIDVVDNGYEIPHLRVGGFCPGWLDAHNHNNDYYDFFKNGNAQKKINMEYKNVYSYTEVFDSIWSAKTVSTIYVPLVSSMVEWHTEHSAISYWHIGDVRNDVKDFVATESTMTFENNNFVEKLSIGHLKKMEGKKVKVSTYDPSNSVARQECPATSFYMDADGTSNTAEAVSFEKLKASAGNKADKENTYIAYRNGNLISSDTAYPYPAVIKNVDVSGNVTNEYAHYGEWLGEIDNTLAYYEKYSDTDYGYYSLVTDPITGTAWILDTLQDRVAIEDGYGLLTEYTLGSLSYDLYVANKGTAVPGTIDVSTLQPVSGLNFEVNDGAVRKVVSASNLTNFYKLPFERQFTERNAGDGFYDLIVFNANERGTENENGKEVITQFASLYNPHFAKAVKNLEAVAEDTTPSNVYVRSARQLNALGRNDYYWSLKGGNNNQKVTFVQENDINFSDYAYVGEKEDGKKLTSYLGQEFDLQDFKKDYANHVIGESYGTPFTNIYDGRSNRIIDYCLDGGETTHFTGLFGEIKNATLKNIVMVVSSNPKGKGGVITSSYRTRYNETGDGEGDWRKRENRVGLGALLGMANNDWGKNTIENCVASGYTVKYVLINRPDTIKPLDNFVLGNTIEPLGVAIGGLIGYSVDNISNCAAVNDVVVELEKDYIHTYDNYYNYNRNNGSGTGGVVYMGGFIGSFFYGKVNDCYSGGSIDIIDNGYRIPQLRVASFCPGWIDTMMNTLSYKDYEKNGQDYRSFEYVNVYSYTDISAHIWEVDTETTHYIPLVSRLVDYFDRGINNQDDDEKWIHNEMIPEIYAGFTNNYYLQELSEEHLEHMSNVGNDIKNMIKPSGVAQITSKELKVKATTHVADDRTYLNADSEARTPYPYQAVIKDVETGEYVHYGPWYEKIMRYLTYFEEYEDGYGYHYVKEDGTVVSNITDDHAKPILNAGYGYLTLTAGESDVADVNKSCIKICGTNYYLDVLSATDLRNLTNNSISKSDKYHTFKMNYTSELQEYPMTLCINSNFGAALMSSDKIEEFGELGSETNELQVRTKAQFESVGTVVTEGSYIKQTHDVDMNHQSQTITITEDKTTDENGKVISVNGMNVTGGVTVHTGIHYNGSSDDECVIKNASDTVFAVNNGTISKTKVVLFDSTDSAKEMTAGFVVKNNGIVETSSVTGTVVASKEAAGFVLLNQGTVRNCTVGDKNSEENTVVQAERAYGFARANAGTSTEDMAKIVNSNAQGMVKSIKGDKSVWGEETIWSDVKLFNYMAIGFVGVNAGEITGSKVYVKNNDTQAVIEGPFAIGFVGVNHHYPYEGKIQNSSVYGTQTGTASSIKGTSIAAGFVSVNNSIITESYVRAENSYKDVVIEGGEAYGFIYSNNSRVEKSFVVGTVTGPTIAAGFCGSNNVYNKYGIENCYANANVSISATLDANRNSNAGASGFVHWSGGESEGRYYENHWIKNSYASGSVSGYITFGFGYSVYAENCYTIVNQDKGVIKQAFSNPEHSRRVNVSWAKDATKNIEDIIPCPDADVKTLEQLASEATPSTAHPFTEGLNNNMYPYENYDCLDHYGDWPDGTIRTLASRYPTYFEEYEDGYGYSYVDENGITINELTKDHAKKIVRTGYGYLTSSSTDATVTDEKAQKIIGTRTYYLQVLSDPAKMYGSVSVDWTKKKYVEFKMTYYTPEREVLAENVSIYMNPHFAAGVSGRSDLGEKTNPFQVRTKAQFVEADYNSLPKYIKQTHDIDLAGGFTPITVHEGSTYYGSANDNCVITNAEEMPFNINYGTIQQTKVFVKTNSSIDYDVAGFISRNYGIIENCSVDADIDTTKYQNRAFGFVYENGANGTIKNCSVTGTIKGKFAYGFVCKNNVEKPAEGETALIENCTVSANVIGYGPEVKNNSSDEGIEAAGFCDRNFAGGTITGCSVTGTIEGTMTESDEPYSEAVGFVDVNKGSVISCTVGDKDSDAITVVKGDDAAGFVEKNENGASIDKCSVAAKTVSTGNDFEDEHGDNNGTASGFAEHNKEATITECIVYIEDKDNEPAIQGNREAYGFAEKNEGTISNSKVIATGTATIEGKDGAIGFVKDNGTEYKDEDDDGNEITVKKSGEIKGCHVGDIAHADAITIQSHRAYGFTEINTKGSLIEDSSIIANVKGHSSCRDGHTNCHVIGVAGGRHVTCHKASDSNDYNREATGFVDYNYGTIRRCKVGDKDNNARCVIEARDAYGFAEKNRKGGTIDNCTVFATISGTNQAAGFIEENGDDGSGVNKISNSTVYLKDSSEETPAIYCEDVASGFAIENIGTIEKCSVLNVETGSIVGGYEADGFIRYNGMQETKETTDGPVVDKIIGYGKISECYVGDRNNSTGMIIKGEKSYGFAKENNSYSNENGKELYSEMSKCYVAARIITFEDLTPIHDTDAAYGMVGTNWAKVTDCHVGYLDDAENKVEIQIEGSRAYGFTRENRGSITESSVVGTGGLSIIVSEGVRSVLDAASNDSKKDYIEHHDTGIATGFVSDNYGTIQNSYVRAVNGYEDVLIDGYDAYGFASDNKSTIDKCFVVATINAKRNGVGFAYTNRPNNASITNSYVNAEITANGSDNRAVGFVQENHMNKNAGGRLENCYACGSLTGSMTYGFVANAGRTATGGYTVKNCYTVMEQNPTGACCPFVGFSVGSGKSITYYNVDPDTCFWAYDEVSGFNVKLANGTAPDIEGKDWFKKTLAELDDRAEDTDAGAFCASLKDKKYPYATFGLKHYGDWPEEIRVNQAVNGEDWLRAGLYYCEEYTNPYTGEVTMGVYAEGDYHDKDNDRRALGRTVNTLIQGDSLFFKRFETKRYYGVYYHVDMNNGEYCHSNDVWTSSWWYSFNGETKSLFKDLPQSVITIPDAFTNYRFCRITEPIGMDEDFPNSATVTIGYVTNGHVTNTEGQHTDTNYEYLYDQQGDKNDTTTDAERAAGLTLTITLEEVEAARKDAGLGR